MQVSAIRNNYSAAVINTKKVLRNSEINTESASLPPKMSMITFKSGNPRHIAHVVAEEPLFGFNGGGVGTVVNDYNFLHKDLDKVVKIIPLYNQELKYKAGASGDPIAQGVEVRKIPNNLPDGHPFKNMQGQAFVTSGTIDATTDLAKFLEKEKDKIFLLEEVGSTNMNWGFEENLPVKMYRAKKDANLLSAMDKKGMPKDLQNKLEFVFTYVDSISSMPRQYADGNSYASMKGNDELKRIASGWQGQAYAKFNKATVELMPQMSEKLNIDPKYFLCSDGQSMFTMHYAAEKNAAGNSYWQDKFLGGVGHNMNRGYIQEMGARQAIVNLGATKEDLIKLTNSKEYLEALKAGNEEEFLKNTVLKNFYKESSGMNAFTVPVHYATVGYSPMLTTVSEGYHDSIISNELISPLHEELKKLDKLGRFKGLVNPLTDPNVTPFKDTILQAGYKNDVKLKLADGSEVTVNKFKVFDPNKTDLTTVRDIKRQNKINLFERFSDKFLNAQAFDSKTNTWMDKGTGRMQILTGQPARKAKIYGNIAQEYIDKLNKNQDVKLIVSWGRGDFQKGMDTVIDTFEKYAKKDKDAVLLFGGDMKYEPETVEKFKKLLNKSELKGRMVLMDGWTPGKDFAMAGDVALLPSRFAPCELTDLEAKKALCTPVVPNVQGMAQKNFDPLIEAEKQLMDGYKGKHEYFMTEDVAYKAANTEAKQKFDTVKNALKQEIAKDYKSKLNTEIPEDLMLKKLEGNHKYQKALKNLRDSVISDELSECLERALITDRNNSNAEKILANQIKADTTWFGNGRLSSTKTSSGDLYFKYHFNNQGQNIKDKDLIKLNFSGLTELSQEVSGSRKIGGKLSQWFKHNKRLTIVGASVLGLAGLGYAGYKVGWLSPKFVEEKKDEHISRVV